MTPQPRPPEFLFLEIGKFCKKVNGRDRFNPFDHLERSYVWVSLNKQVNMIWHHFDRVKNPIIIGTNFSNNPFGFYFNSTNKNLVPILRAKDNMIPDGVF